MEFSLIITEAHGYNKDGGKTTGACSVLGTSQYLVENDGGFCASAQIQVSYSTKSTFYWECIDQTN